MASLNKIILIGYLGRDPEIRYTQDGLAVTNFNIATTEKWTDKASGEKKREQHGLRITAWGRQGKSPENIFQEENRFMWKVGFRQVNGKIRREIIVLHWKLLPVRYLC